MRNWTIQVKTALNDGTRVWGTVLRFVTEEYACKRVAELRGEGEEARAVEDKGGYVAPL